MHALRDVLLNILCARLVVREVTFMTYKG